jgi:uncharacterized protein YprB with RNaseH-like and TPR domain/predicted nuclease with RNAse H fold/dephospho-CoA kinase
MLSSTFQHLKGIGAKKELALWSSGIVSWDRLETKQEPQLSLFAASLNGNGAKGSFFYASRKAMAENDAEFFAKTLPRQEHYRIALSFPSQTLFLDIETTGLSRYYDTITIVGWSMDAEYRVYIKGGDETALREALKEAKAVVTFNGTLFDLPFLSQEFSDLHIPSAHIDLRFLAKRVGLSGGQKRVERLLGINRSAFLQNLAGETAPLLWYKFLRGDLDAFRLLLSYNRADVGGMKLIFNALIPRLMEKEQIPQYIRPTYRFSDVLKDSKWPSKESYTGNGKNLRYYQEKAGPALSLKDLVPKSDLSYLRIVGIDLTGSEKRSSGWCLLEGEHAFTQRIASDADIIAATLDAKPTLVSIDSPLSLPKGRVSVSDDDPGRNEYGITRYCERELKKRGINVYPCLIKSMQGLTARGMRLAAQLRSLGVPVIESYPGAAQDIMNIPRKRVSLEFLKNGLAEFGIRGDYTKDSVSHDELDAITSALVGVFFWSGKFEALGNDDEEYLIIPDVKNAIRGWRKRKVVGLSGPIAAGKTTAGEFLKLQGFHYGRFSLVLADILHARGITPTRSTLQKLGEEINKNPGQRWLCQALVRKLPDKGDLVIDGLRFPDDHALLVETFGPSFLHVHVASPTPVRQERFISLGGMQKQFARASAHPVEANVDKLASLAHMGIKNSRSQKSFISKISHIVDHQKNCRG